MAASSAIDDRVEQVTQQMAQTPVTSTAPQLSSETVKQFKALEDDYLTQEVSDEKHPLNVIIKAIGLAENSIDIFMFTFQDRKIQEALERAIGQDVREIGAVCGVSKRLAVKIYADKSQYDEQEEMQNVLHDLRSKGCTVKLCSVPTTDSFHGLLHLKMMFIDRQLTLSGSYNYSKRAAEYSIEQLSVVFEKNTDWFLRVETLIKSHVESIYLP